MRNIVLKTAMNIYKEITGGDGRGSESRNPTTLSSTKSNTIELLNLKDRSSSSTSTSTWTSSSSSSKSLSLSSSSPLSVLCRQLRDNQITTLALGCQEQQFDNDDHESSSIQKKLIPPPSLEQEPTLCRQHQVRKLCIALRSNSSLQYVSLGHLLDFDGRHGHYADQIISAMTHIPTLTSLKLQLYSSIRESTWKKICNQCRSLRHLELNGTTVQADSQGFVGRLSPLPFSRSSSSYDPNHNLKTTKTTVICPTKDMHTLDQLVSLRLISCDLEDQDILGVCTYLEQRNKKGDSHKEDGWSSSKLLDLSLSGNPKLSTLGLSKLLTLPILSNIRKLDLSECALDSVIVTTMAQTLGDIVSSTTVTSTKNTQPCWTGNLEELILSKNYRLGGCTSPLSALIKAVLQLGVRHLDLSYCNPTKEQVTELFQFLSIQHPPTAWTTSTRATSEMHIITTQQEDESSSSSFCRLESLLLQGCDNHQLPDPVLFTALLHANNPYFKYLDLSDPCFPSYLPLRKAVSKDVLLAIAKGMQNNYSLQRLEVQYRPQYRSIAQEIEMYVELNCAGRQILMQPKTTHEHSGPEDWISVTTHEHSGPEDWISVLAYVCSSSGSSSPSGTTTTISGVSPTTIGVPEMVQLGAIYWLLQNGGAEQLLPR